MIQLLQLTTGTLFALAAQFGHSRGRLCHTNWVSPLDFTWASALAEPQAIIFQDHLPGIRLAIRWRSCRGHVLTHATKYADRRTTDD